MALIDMIGNSRSLAPSLIVPGCTGTRVLGEMSEAMVFTASSSLLV